MEGMSQGLLATQSMQAGGLIGRGVLAPGTTLVLEGGQAKAGATLANPADRVVVTVLNKAGARVAALDLGARPAGTLTFAWDGKTAAGATAPDGIYTFEVAAAQGNGKVEVKPLGYRTRAERDARGAGSAAQHLRSGRARHEQRGPDSLISSNRSQARGRQWDSSRD